MKLVSSIFLFFLIILCSSTCFSQNEVEISGKKYVLHTVKKSETVFSLCQKYKVSQTELLTANPGLPAVLKLGSTVKIPTVKVEPTEPKKVEITKREPKEDFYYHKVVKGQTIYSITKQYGITTDILTQYNPDVKAGLNVGQVLKIPVRSDVDTVKSVPVVQESVAKPAEKTELPVTTNCNQNEANKAKKYKVALLMPFHLPGTDQLNSVGIDKAQVMSKIVMNTPVVSVTDTATQFNVTNIDPKIEGFIEFYEGALLAIDSLQRKGMNLELYVFDASSQKMINALLQLEEFLDLSLIIGPVYPELQESVASFAAKNRIAVISPLSPMGNFESNNSWYFKANPTRDYQIEQTANYMGSEFSGKNYVLLQLSGNSTSTEARLGQMSKEKLGGQAVKNLFHEYNFQLQGVNSIRSVLSETGENVFVIPTDNEAQVSVAITNLTALAENYNIVLMGTPNLIKFKSLQTENFHRLRLRYLSPYFIDYNKPLVRRFVSLYRETFSDEPSQFSHQGFDVSYYFLSALFRYGKDFRNCLPDYRMELTQMVFDFKKVAPMGGYMNNGLFVTSYERNFDILNLGTTGGK